MQTPFVDFIEQEIEKQNKIKSFSEEVFEYNPFAEVVEVVDGHAQINLDKTPEYINPLQKVDEYSNFEFDDEFSFEKNGEDLFFENELSDSELRKAIEQNTIYADKYGWRKYGKELFNYLAIIQDGVTPNMELFTKRIADWQKNNGYSAEGIFGINLWTYFQRKLGLHNLSNEFNIDVKKAIKANKKYKRELWGENTKLFFEILNKGNLLSDEYFAYAIAKFQAEKTIKIDGILGPSTLKVIRPGLIKINPGFGIDSFEKAAEMTKEIFDKIEERLKNEYLFLEKRFDHEGDLKVALRPVNVNVIALKTVISILGNYSSKKTQEVKTEGFIIPAILIGSAIAVGIIEYFEKRKEREETISDIKGKLKLLEIIEKLKNSSWLNESSHEIKAIIESNAEIAIANGSNIKAELEKYKMYLNDLAALIADPFEIKAIAYSNFIKAFSKYTRIIIDANNSITEIYKWGIADIKNVKDRRNIGIAFSNIHPINNSIYEQKIGANELKILSTLVKIWEGIPLALNQLYFDKHIVFRFDSKIKGGIFSQSTNVYISTIKESERVWDKRSTIEGGDGSNIYFDDRADIPFGEPTRRVVSNLKNNYYGHNYYSMILEIVNHVMEDVFNNNLKIKLTPLIYEVNQEDGENIFLEQENSLASPTNLKFSPSTSSYFSPEINLQKTKVNQSQLSNSGLSIQSLTKALSNYFDLGFIELFLTDMNTRATGAKYSIDKTYSTLDSVIAEAVHQFQINNFINPKEHDGILGPSTLDTLGFYNHGLTPKLRSSGFYGQGILNKIGSTSINSNSNGEFSNSNWFTGIVKPSWLGVKITQGVHILLYRQLKKAEDYLLSLPQHSGLSKAELGIKLGFNKDSSFSGARLSSEKQAMHGFGLAIDINIGGNPWIGAGWQKTDTEKKRMLLALKKASGENLNGSIISNYLHDIATRNGFDTYGSFDELKLRNDQFVSYIKTNSAELRVWNSSFGFGSRNPLNGFLNLDRDLVYALRHVAGLAWGAIDFGPNSSGDIMHFDLRTLGAGKLICGKIGGFVPATGHPSITQETFSEEIMFEQVDDEETKEEQPFNEAIENTEWKNDNYEVETKRSYSGNSQKPAKIFLTLTGEKQGVIKGSVTQKGKEGAIALYAFHHEISSPRDSASGMATGKRIHKPIVITKEVDLSSAKLLSALVMNEKLKQVVIHFWRPTTIGTTGGTGVEVNYYRVTLTNAFISNISQDRNATAEMNATVIERVEFVYEKIEWQWLEGSNLTTTDDWRKMNELEFYEAIEEKVSEENEMMDEWEWEDQEFDEINNEEDESEEQLMEIDGDSENVTAEDNFFEAFVPTVALPDIRKRIDDYFVKANSDYKTDKGASVKVRAQFRIRDGGSILSEDAKTKVRKALSGKSCGISNLLIHNAAYGRVKPAELAKITRCLINAGELAKLRVQNTSLSDEQLIRLLQREFGIGIDCGGYVQLAFIFAYTGSDNDTTTVRNNLGLKERRGHENLGSLPSKHFEKIDKLNAQTGDLIVMNPRANDDGSIHTVIIVEHTKSGDVHKYLVDASWGFLYGDIASGINRRTFEFDTLTSEWSDIHPISGNKVFTNSIGPYNSHPIKGVYRARLKK